MIEWQEDVDGRKGNKQMITKLCGFIGCIQCADAIMFKCIVDRNIFLKADRKTLAKWNAHAVEHIYCPKNQS
jgi:hypothetical protein